MKYYTEFRFLSSYDETHEFFVYASMTLVIMQLTTKSVIYKFGIIDITARPSISHTYKESEISEVVNDFQTIILWGNVVGVMIVTLVMITPN